MEPVDNPLDVKAPKQDQLSNDDDFELLDKQSPYGTPVSDSKKPLFKLSPTNNSKKEESIKLFTEKPFLGNSNEIQKHESDSESDSEEELSEDESENNREENERNEKEKEQNHMKIKSVIKI